MRPADAVVTARVERALQEDTSLYDGHISVVTENGTVTLQGLVRDLGDYRRALILARRIAGRGRVVNKMEYVPEDDDSD